EDRLADGIARRLLWVFVIERPRLDLAPGQVHLQQLVHLFELQLVIGGQRDLALVARDRAFAALEVEPGRDLAVDAGDRVVDLGKLDPGNNIEARHWQRSFSQTSIITSAI